MSLLSSSFFPSPLPDGFIIPSWVQRFPALQCGLFTLLLYEDELRATIERHGTDWMNIHDLLLTDGAWQWLQEAHPDLASELLFRKIAG